MRVATNKRSLNNPPIERSVENALVYDEHGPIGSLNNPPIERSVEKFNLDLAKGALSLNNPPIERSVEAVAVVGYVIYVSSSLNNPPIERSVEVTIGVLEFRGKQCL